MIGTTGSRLATAGPSLSRIDMILLLSSRRTINGDPRDLAHVSPLSRSAHACVGHVAYCFCCCPTCVFTS